jgi:hypothetical protein
MKTILPALPLLLLTTSFAQAAPDPFQASYSVSVKGITLGNMDARLSYNGNTYTYQKLTKANGLAAILSGDTLEERSKGSRQGDTLTPGSYIMHHQNKRKNRRDDVTFTSPTAANGSYDGNNYQLGIPAGTLDAALLELRLMDDVPANKPLHYQTVGKGKLHDYQFRKLGQETLQTAAGNYECIKLQQSSEDGKYQTTVWLAPALNYGIVQIRHKDDDETIEARLTRYQAG